MGSTSWSNKPKGVCQVGFVGGHRYLLKYLILTEPESASFLGTLGGNTSVTRPFEKEDEFFCFI